MVAFDPASAPARGAKAKNPPKDAFGYDPKRTPARILLKQLTFPRSRKWLLRNIRLKRALRELAKYPKHADAPRHQLPGELVISLTSYPARFAALHLTVKSLIDQTVRPDRIVLWVAHEHLDQVPAELRALEGDLFTIRACEDLRNFKKILPSLEAFPGAFILICDDDTYYPDSWLQQLLDTYDRAQPSVVCHRAHRLTRTPTGEIAPYRAWKRNVATTELEGLRKDLLPTGNGGVLYPPGSLAPETTNLELIRKLSPTSDDIWLFFMWQKAGWSVRRVPGPRRRFLEWPATQETALHAFHRTGTKDQHIHDMSRHFGIP